MKVRFNGKEIETEARTILELLKEHGINPETVVVKKGKEIVLEEERLEDGDEIETIRVVSGG